eukprot:1150050-Pelagomonas_calceolata.AAC.10
MVMIYKYCALEVMIILLLYFPGQANVEAAGISLGQLRIGDTGFCGADKRSSWIGRELAGHAPAQDLDVAGTFPLPKGVLLSKPFKWSLKRVEVIATIVMEETSISFEPMGLLFLS